MKSIVCIGVMGMGLLMAGCSGEKSEMDGFIDELMAQMTLEEKLGQINLQPGSSEVLTGHAMDTEVGGMIADGQLGALLSLYGRDKVYALQKVAVENSRLGIPLLFGLDVIHGFETILPIPLAQSCSWDIEGIEAGARMAASECSTQGIDWVYSPMVDIAADARWGRIAEGNGEDPYLGSRIAAAMVRGYQGSQYGESDVMACVKHYALYGAAESGRDYNTVDMSHLRMYNQYLNPYKAAVEAGAGSFMSSFNIIDGQAATANKWLLDDVLRQQWQFGGFVVTDYGSIDEMTVHGLGDETHCATQALKAGTDMDMCSRSFLEHGKEALEQGLITEELIDRACRLVLEAKYKLGLFQNPYKYCELSDEEVSKRVYTEENRALARELAAETFVLLKNEGGVLPLRKQGRIALIGPNANTTRGMLGCWTINSPASDSYPSLRQAMETAVAGKAQVLYAQGCNLTEDSRLLKAGMSEETIPVVDADAARREAIAIASQADVIVCAMGEGSEWTGESMSRTSLELPECQKQLLKELLALGKPLVMLNYSGRPTAMAWEKENIPAIMNVWFGGSEMGNALCDVLFGDKSPCGHLTTSIPKVTGQEPLYYNHLNTGRPKAYDQPEFSRFQSNYMDVSNGPAFPFGYGLSYTTFQYSDMEVTTAEDGLTASITVTNTGNYDAYDVVQCYIHDIACRYARPVKELKGFERIYLKVGQNRKVAFNLTQEDLSYYDFDGQLFFEPGEFDIMIGPDSRDVQTVRINL